MTGVIWLNGEWRENTAAIEIGDRGFLLGDGIFETILMRSGRPAFLEKHLARLCAGLQELNIAIDIPGDIRNILSMLANKNNVAEKTVAARFTISRGAAPRGLIFPAKEEARPTLLISLSKLPTINDTPVSLIVSRYRRSEVSISSRLKTTNYLDNILARNEAAAAGADDALMLNGRGRVACVSSANIFLIKRSGAIVTPPIEEGALPGIVRALIIQGAKHLSIPLSEETLDLGSLDVDGIFLTNSLIGLKWAHFGESEPAPEEIFNSLKAWYQQQLDDNLKPRPVLQ